MDVTSLLTDSMLLIRIKVLLCLAFCTYIRSFYFHTVIPPSTLFSTEAIFIIAIKILLYDDVLLLSILIYFGSVLATSMAISAIRRLVCNNISDW